GFSAPARPPSSGGRRMKLSIHHVGGRAGSRPFPLVEAFEKDIVSVLYDADPDCLAHARQANAQLASALHVLPYCLAESCKTTSFRLNYDPYASSMYPTNPEYASFYGRLFSDYDYVWRDITPIQERRI